MSVHVGTSGWSYPSGKGQVERAVLPGDAVEARRNGRLRRAAVLRRALRYGRGELHASTVSRAPTSRRDGRRGRRAAFEFSLKLYQKFTHPKMFREAALKSAPGSEGPLLDLLAMVTQSDIDDFRAGIDPIARAGKLGALLAQFPPSFKSSAGLARLPRASCCASSPTTRWRWSCDTAAGATRSARRCRC